MRHPVLVLLILVTAPLAPLRAQRASTAALPNEVRALFEALVTGDTAGLRGRVAPNLTWVVGANGARIDRKQLLAAAAHPQVPAPRFDLDSLEVRHLGVTALVQFRRTDRRQVGRREVATHARVSEVYVLEHGRWQLAHHTQTWQVAPVIPFHVDSTLAKQYVGRYEIAAGYVDDVRWTGERLVATASGQREGAHLVPVSDSVFSPDGVGALIAFERDGTGRVTGYVQGYPDGTVFRASRLP